MVNGKKFLKKLMDKYKKAKSFFENGVKCYLSKNFEEAEKNFLKALEIAPTSFPVLENLSKVYLAQEKYNEAEKKLNYLISLDKENDSIGYYLLLDLYIKKNNYFDLQLLNDFAWKRKKINSFSFLSNKLTYPRFFNNSEDIKKIRSYFSKQINEMINDKNLPTLNLSERLLKPANFELIFDGNDNLEISKKLFCLYNKIYPEIQRISNFQIKKNEKINIGFISEFFTDHSIMKLYEGFIYKLNKEIFNVFVFHSNLTKDGFRNRRMKESVVLYDFENIELPKNFYDKIKIIKEKSLDILFYTDIHLSTNLYYLTLIKLAKVQMTSIGHADTTGNKNIDYFLSSKLLEGENHQNRYSEKVLLSNYIPIYYYKPNVTKELSKNDLVKKNIYFCPQNLIKILPDFDKVFRKILFKDKNAKIFLIKDRNNFTNQSFFNRIKRNIPENFERVILINRLTPNDFIKFCGMSSVILSPFSSVGSGNTFYDSMYYGTPTITKPGDSPKNRMVIAGYSQMKIKDAPVVNSFEDYIEKSIEIANQNNLNLKMYYKEQAKKYLYENEHAIRDVEKILISIVNN